MFVELRIRLAPFSPSMPLDTHQHGLFPSTRTSQKSTRVFAILRLVSVAKDALAFIWDQIVDLLTLKIWSTSLSESHMASFAVCVVSDVDFRVHRGGLRAGLQSFGEERDAK